MAVAIFAMGLVIASSQRPSAQGNGTEKTGQSSGKQQQQEAWWELATEPIAVFTLCLVLVGSAQLGVFYWQLRLIRQSLADAKTAADAAKESADTAKIQAEVARDTLKTMQGTAERQLRAYVLVSGATVLNIADPNKRNFQLSVQNFGHTPAHDIKFWMGTVIQGYPIKPDYVFSSPNDEEKGAMPLMSVSILGPGAPTLMEVPVEVTNAWEESELQNNRAAIYAFGHITYIDTFNTERQTAFRYMCHGEGLPKGRASPCHEGNKYT